jgi:hypothetical protein
LITTLFGFSAIGGVSAVTSLGLTNCGDNTEQISDPVWTYWANGSFHVPVAINLTSRCVGEATISAQTSDWFVHHYSFDFVRQNGTSIHTPNLGGSDTGYHFNNLRTTLYHGTWSLDNKCVRYSNPGGDLFGLNKIKFDICNDNDNSKVITMELHLTYQF